MKERKERKMKERKESKKERQNRRREGEREGEAGLAGPWVRVMAPGCRAAHRAIVESQGG